MPKPSAHPGNIAKKATFISALTQGKSVKDAAAASGVHRRTFYDWRDQDAEFARAWEDAQAENVEALEDEVRRRALDPSDKTSHILLMFLLKKHDPSYRENYKREVTITHEKVNEFHFSEAEMNTAIEILTAAKKPTTTSKP